ncbi:hypothetical protein [Desulfosporosinus youngiae]|uniref:Uncharacterized protein n=1 Tax=Desulfosporosinus youngiae DSM 17734 TaxID=768710 RepID=H5XXE0_9FIRM|nr:hypothetical protein [Desulfosporosinus youngiae]EHQ91146.1 hypothetical protein DesyoDRAFT_4187 [Desulfosporosinus youngiae DSM 17734]
MTKFRTIANKTWVFAAATALIIGSSSAMAYALSPDVPTNALNNAAPITAPVTQTNQGQASNAGVLPNYTVIDLSKSVNDRKALIEQKLSMIESITPEQIEEKCKAILANMIPGEKDISAQQAAAEAESILKKAYGVDFQGYTAEASFSRSSVPNSDNWTVIFRSPEEMQNKDRKDVKSYLAGVDSVNGTILNLSSYDRNFTENNNNDKNLGDPEWKNKAEEAIAKLMAENVSITGSKVVSATPAGGVSVVCELSDGSACAVRLTGEDKDMAAYVYFPNGYDGSFDYNPPTTDGVG